jgi:hypothetical protein
MKPQICLLFLRNLLEDDNITLTLSHLNQVRMAEEVHKM